jgi:hypothetical protein
LDFVCSYEKDILTAFLAALLKIAFATFFGLQSLAKQVSIVWQRAGSVTRSDFCMDNTQGHSPLLSFPDLADGTEISTMKR